MVEQWTENPCVGSSILPSTTIYNSKYLKVKYLLLFFIVENESNVATLWLFYSSAVYLDRIRRNKSQAADSLSTEMGSMFSNLP